jgi:methyl-accepting chemotaxis protein
MNSQFNFNPSVKPASEESLKDYFLKNINNSSNNDADAPILIEERLKALFSNFISDFSGTMDSLHGTFLESCVSKLSSTINFSIQEIIKAEVVTALYDKVFKHLSEFPLPPNRNEKLQEFFNDKLDSLQDIMIGLNSETSLDLSYIKSSIQTLEHELHSSFSDIRSQISEAASKEETRFEQNKRRMSDFHSSVNAMNHKLDFLVNNLQNMIPLKPSLITL